LPDQVPVVLVVDLDPETHLATEGALSETECATLGARTAEMALKHAARRPPSVLVVDAKIGGLAFLTERLRRLSPHLHVVLLVGADHHSDAPLPGTAHPAPRHQGPTTVLRKPVDRGRYRSTVRTVLRLTAMSEGVHRMRDAGERASETPSPSGPPAPRLTPVPRIGRDK
jgi:DNA-binding NtrC family response regulator